VDIGGHGMVAETGMVTGQAEHGVDPVGIGPDDVALHGQPVAVPGHHLEDRVQIHLTQGKHWRQNWTCDHGCLVVGDIDRVHIALEQGGFLDNSGKAPRGSAFSGYRQFTRCQYFFQYAFCFHYAKSSLRILRGPPPRPVRQSLAEMTSSYRSSIPSSFMRPRSDARHNPRHC
jgi:hypothetical protein